MIIKLIPGATAQGEVTADKKDFLDWTDSTKFEVHIESKLGSFNETLPQQVMDVYNVSDHWQEYASMISDIRTVCPLQELADYASKNFVANVFSYVATQPKLDSMDGIADKTVDVSAIFGMFVCVYTKLFLIQPALFVSIHNNIFCFIFRNLSNRRRI